MGVSFSTHFHAGRGLKLIFANEDAEPSSLSTQFHAGRRLKLQPVNSARGLASRELFGKHWNTQPVLAQKTKSTFVHRSQKPD